MSDDETNPKQELMEKIPKMMRQVATQAGLLPVSVIVAAAALKHEPESYFRLKFQLETFTDQLRDVIKQCEDISKDFDKLSGKKEENH